MSQTQTRQRAFSGIQPSGAFTLGNYIGAIRNWRPLQEEYDCLYCVVDMHSITVRQDPAVLRRNTYDAVAMLLAAGIDPARSIVFVQSHVPQHAQLAWVLACSTQFGELSRMTQFKEKSRRHAENINAGLFTYPVLMAADILLYNAHIVPVGEDQKQHVELARDIAGRFNAHYGDTFVLPEADIKEAGGRIMSLQDPAAKMSKSDDNANAYILMADDADTIRRKFRRAVTDSEAVVRRSADKPGVANLMDIYNILTGKTDAETEAEFAGGGYGAFKDAVAEATIAALTPIQAEYTRYAADKAHLESVLKDGAQRAEAMARRLLAKVHKKVGFLPF